MKEELLRIENGLLPVKNKKIILDLEFQRRMRGNFSGQYLGLGYDPEFFSRDYGSENGKNIYL